MASTQKSSVSITRKYLGRLYGFRDKMRRAGAQGARLGRRR